MTLLYLLSYLSLFVQIIFVTVGIAAGLYYLAELVEEYSVLAKKVITSAIFGTTIIYILFIFFDNFPFKIIFCLLCGSFFHLIIMKKFPFIQFLSFPFIGAVITLIINHYLAFNFFTTNYHSFTEVMAYFTLCLWLVPFALFVSLSANDNVLPTLSERTSLLNDDDVVTNYFSSKGKKMGLLSLFSYARESILPHQRNKKAYN